LREDQSVIADQREHRAFETSPLPEGLYQRLVEVVQDYAIFALDSKGYVLTWNVGAERIKGYQGHEIIGRHFSVFYPPERVAEGFPQYELEMASRHGRFEDESWRVRKDGSRFWANVVITAVRDENGAVVGFAKVTRDLTERRQAEVQRVADAQRVAAAEAANRAKSEFLAAMSHELRTPLNAIGGYTDLLTAEVYGPVPDAQREVLQRVRRSQQHLLTIITDLLNYSRIEAGRLSYALTPVAACTMLDAVASMIEPQAFKKGVAFVRAACPSDAVAVVDRSRGEQILLNLLSNAVKFTPLGGRIVISCATLRDRIAIQVSDTGPGIPADKISAIFEPFVQLGRTLNAPHEGTGLGLAISRDLARAMGGDVTVTSVPGEGAVFTLSLPRA